MRVLVLSDTFPNRLQPWRGPYNRRQIECLAELCDVTVINPWPWLRLLREPRSWRLVKGMDDVIPGVTVRHPVFWHIPLIGRATAWRGIARAVERAIDLSGPAEYDVVLATFAYQLGEAARRVARKLGVPYVVKARGSDLNTLPSAGGRRRRTAQALQDAAAVVPVSEALARTVIELGACPGRVHRLPNGVDLEQFRVASREEARRELGLTPEGKLLLFVGSLLPVKGLDVLLDAVPQCATRSMHTVIAGSGPLAGELARRRDTRGLHGAVSFIGQVGRDSVVTWMNAADAVVLPSRNEGCPNVVLEALACGTPVVASNVGAVPDIVTGDAGRTVPPEDAAELAAAIDEVLGMEWDREAVRAQVEGMTWQANAKKLYDVLCRAAGPRGDADHSCCERENATVD